MTQRLDSNMTQLFGKEQHFYHASVRKYVALFGSLFTDIYVKRTADDGKVDYVTVPIRYANGNMYSKVAQDESREIAQVARIVPAMAFKLENIYKDVARKTNGTNRIYEQAVNPDGTKNYQFNPVPYNLLFSLHIRTKNNDDMLQIVEQIVPAFDGNIAVTIEDTTGIRVDRDIIIVLDEISQEDNYDDDIQVRLINWKITFELKGYLYKRTQNKLVIREVDFIDISNEYDPQLLLVVTDQFGLNPLQTNLTDMTTEVENIPTTPVKVTRQRKKKNE